MRATLITKALATADADGVCASQTPAGAGDLTIVGALASGGAVTFDSPRQVLFTTAADESGKTFTVHGTDEVGQTISETVTGPNATTGATTYSFATVTRIAVSAALTGAVTVGTNGVGHSKGVLFDAYKNPFNASLLIELVSGTGNVTVQYTSSNHRASGFHWGGASWADHGDLTSKTASTHATATIPWTGVRLKVNSGTGTWRMTVRQAG